MRKLNRRRCASNRPLGRGGEGGIITDPFHSLGSSCLMHMEPSVPHLHTVLNINSVVKASRLDRRVGRSGLVSLASRQWLKRREK